MTDPVVSSYPGYATPTFYFVAGHVWGVSAQPQGEPVGNVQDWGVAGWTAIDPRFAYVGLFPDKQAAGEALVKHAGYEVLR